MKKELKDLLLILAVWTAGTFFAGSLFEVYFFNLGMSIPEIYLADTIWFLTSLLLIPFFKGFKRRTFMLLGILASFLAVLLLYIYPDPNAAYIYRFFLGSIHFFFWIPFNTTFYEYRKKKVATLGAVYYAVGPALSLMLPAVSGTIAGSLGFGTLFLVAMATYAVSFCLAFSISEKEYKYDFSQSLRSISGLKSVSFLEGFAVSTITSLTLPVMLLLFISTPIEFGWFLSLVTIFSLAASFFVSELSDKYRKRSMFLLPSAIAFAISAIVASQTDDVVIFFIGFGMINFAARLFSPISLALAIDNQVDTASTMVGREFMLNAGRLAGAVLGYLILVSFSIHEALLFQGLFMLLYAPLFELKKNKLRRR